MTDWERVVEELQETGYSGFEFESGETAVPGLSGEWVAGDIVREDRLRRENQSLWVRILDSLPGSGGAVTTNPEAAPESIRNIAKRHKLEVVIISVEKSSVRIALCDSSAKPSA
jgi:sugar phosphate isomerase/epimerase